MGVVVMVLLYVPQGEMRGAEVGEESKGRSSPSPNSTNWVPAIRDGSWMASIDYTTLSSSFSNNIVYSATRK